jgi:signal transduction histidine kinase
MTQSSKYGTIMVVDDKPSNLKLLGSILKEEGYQVRIFPRGDLAVKSAASDPPDLILLDVTMPGMDGYEVCRLLKENPVTRDLPVIFISALSETTDKMKAFMSGGVDFITKPFQVEEVNARVEIHLTLKRVKADLEEKNRILEKALDELKMAQQVLVQSEKMAALGVLVAGIAHEINNPVNFIKTSTTSLEKDIEDICRLLETYDECEIECPTKACLAKISGVKKDIDFPVLTHEIPQMVSNILEGVRRTEEIVNSLRSYSRLDGAGKQVLDIRELINAALSILKTRYAKKIQVIREFKNVPSVSVHPGKMIQVFINIIGNAIDALERTETDREKKITITTEACTINGSGWIKTDIKDNGPGIPGSILSRIFDPFFTTKDVGKGTGLGLSISIGIIKEHKGTIEVESGENIGASFSLMLPIAEEKP